MFSIPSFLSRAAGAAKPIRGEAAAAPAVNHAAKPPASAGPAHKPGTDAPEDLQGNQGPAKEEKSESKWGDRLQTAGNLAMVGSMVQPMLPSLGGDKDKGSDPNADGNMPPGVQDKEEYNQEKAMTNSGMSAWQPNW